MSTIPVQHEVSWKLQSTFKKQFPRTEISTQFRPSPVLLSRESGTIALIHIQKQYKPEMTYRPLTELHDLPPEEPLSNASREKQDLEFKSEADRATPWEHAKDIAALANSLGGTIIVGASNKERVSLHGLRRQTAQEVMEIYESAAMMCSPVIPIDVVPITLSSGASVVAVNVPAYPDTLVGAPGAAKIRHREPNVLPDGGKLPRKPTHMKAENSWRFPIRRASQTHFVTP